MPVSSGRKVERSQAGEKACMNQSPGGSAFQVKDSMLERDIGRPVHSRWLQ
jgi:hypothetical protein